MTAQQRDIAAVLGIEWVHVFEQDTAAGAVFLPVDADIPLSRRPRQRLILRPGGSASWLTGGPDDRPTGRDCQWTEVDGEIIVRDTSNTIVARIIEWSADRLIVRLP